MSSKVFFYWVLFIGITLGGVIFGWPGETPTYRMPIWLPSGPSDSSLAADWLQKPSQSIRFSEFKEKTFAATWSFVTYLQVVMQDPENEPQFLIHLGRDGLGNIFFTWWAIGGTDGIVPWPESWLRPSVNRSAEIDPAGFLIVKTRQEIPYPFKSGLIAMILSLILICLLYNKIGTDSRLLVRFPVTLLPESKAKEDEKNGEKEKTVPAPAADTPSVVTSKYLIKRKGTKPRRYSGAGNS